MTPILPTRREALGTGARLLAGLTLAGVPAADAIAESLSRPAHALHTDPELVALLNRPNPEFFGGIAEVLDCCSVCDRIRRTPFVCSCCGYEGPRRVDPCCCEAERQSTIANCVRWLAEPEEREGAHADFQRWLTEARAEGVRPTCRAVEGGTGSPCGHGLAVCPVCASDGDGEPRIDVEMAVDTIRQLRTALAARGLV